MSTPSLNNGIFLRDTSYTMNSKVDGIHLMNQIKNPQPMDLGPVELWAMMQKVEMPLYQFSNFNGKNVIMVDSPTGEYKWQTPVSIDMPYVIEDIDSQNTQKGIDGTTFRIKLSRREFGNGDIFTYDKMNGLEFLVTDDDIQELGDGVIYTVRLMNNDSTAYLDNKFLKSGTPMFRISSAKNSDYGERYSTISVRSGFREYYNFVGNADAHVEMHVSSAAHLMAANGMNADGTIPVTEIWRSFDKNVMNDPSIRSLNQMAAVMGQDYMKKAESNGDLRRSFITNMEAAHLSKIGRDIENYLMWGKGGYATNNDSPADIRMSVGLWKQLDSAFKRIYNKSNFSLDMFSSELFNFFNGKVEFKGPDPQRTLIVQTGMGGFRMISKAIENKVGGTGFVIQAAENNGIGAVSGKGMNLGFGYAYTSYIIPYLGRLIFQLNPAFDNVETNLIENPPIEGFNLSSYSFIIYDITEGRNDNIFLLKKKWDNQLRWFYQNGTMDYMGRTSGFQSSGNHTGYIVKMSQAHPAIWVKDPTKILKIVMKNPVTGGSL